MTSRRVALASFVASLALAGCSSDPGTKPTPVTVTGRVLGPGGQPARDVTLCFNPTSSGQMQMYAPVEADGKFTVQLIPGKYTYSFDYLAGKREGLAAIPKKYQETSADHTVEIPKSGSSDLTIQLAS